MPSKKRPAAAGMTALPSIPQQLIEQLTASGTPMTAEQINATTMALKKTLIERALGAELSHHLGYKASYNACGDIRKANAQSFSIE